MPYEITYQEISPRIGNPITFVSETASADISPVTDGSTYRISVVAINSLGARGPLINLPDYTVIGKTLPPADVVGFSVSITKYGNYLSWGANTEVDLQEYEVRKGSSWDLGNTIFSGSTSTSFTDIDLISGDSTYLIKAKDTTSNYSINPQTVSTNISLPTTLTVDSSITGEDYRLLWNEPSSTYAIKEYIIKDGTDWSTATLVGTTKATVFQNPVKWSGDKTFLVAAVDIAGNEGVPSITTISISVPTKPTPVVGNPVQVVDNNVLLYWNDCASSLPIKHYILRKGPVFASSELIGEKSGLFTMVFETQGGIYTYWISGVDTAGSEGPAMEVITNVNKPPDYILNSDIYSAFTGTLNNALVYHDEVSLPHNITETWETHFTSRAWSTPQDQINAGYPVFGQPTPTTGYYEEIIDYGSVLSANKITILYNAVVVNNPSAVITISTSPTGPADAPPDIYVWTNYVGVSSIYATNFRYVKIRITVTSTGTDFMDIEMLNVKLDAKIIEDSGRVLQCISTDTGDGGNPGTQVNFNIPFVDVVSITTSINTTAAVSGPPTNWPHTLIVDFLDAPNPTGFRVLWYDKNGTRINSPANYYVAWSAKGY